MRAFWSILLWIYFGLCFLFFFLMVSLIFPITYPFDRYRRIPNRVLKGLGFMMIKINPGWQVKIKGTENYKGGRPTIFVANHQSFLDMPVTYLLPWTMKWVAKKSLFRIPVLGWIIFMTGHLGIDRKSLSSVKMLDKLVEPIQAGVPAMFFPEGTRTTTGEIGRFKNGAFTLARQYNFQLQPLVLYGGHKALPAGSWKFNFRQEFHVSVLGPVDPNNFESVEGLKNHVHNELQQELYLLARTEK